MNTSISIYYCVFGFLFFLIAFSLWATHSMFYNRCPRYGLIL